MISAFDKGNKINKWNISIIPGVQDMMVRYINVYWRPRHEKWRTTDNGGNGLYEGLLFPSVQCFSAIQKTSKNHFYHIYRIVKETLKRCGITGHRAHSHAFRKGVVTELLRAGNPLKTVSVFVHHQSTAVTEQSYDKRKNEEHLERMVLPIGWERLSHDVSISEQMELHDASSTTNTNESENIQLASAMLHAAEHINSLKRDMTLLKALLTPAQMEEFDRARCMEQETHSPIKPTITQP